MKLMKFPFKSKITFIPDVIRCNVPDTWAYDTLTRRVPQGFARLYDENAEFLEKNEYVLLDLKELEASVRAGTGGALEGLTDNAPDNSIWQALLNSIPESERNWIDCPWLLAECYHYRRVVQCFNYFETKYDMYSLQKLQGLEDSKSFLLQMIPSIYFLLKEEQPSVNAVLEVGIFSSLWGNKLDLSLWPTENDPTSTRNESNSSGKIMQTDQFQAIRPYILDDQTNEVVTHLKSLRNITGHLRIIDIIVDNAGYELITDFILAHILLSSKIVDKVRFHTKIHPTFVSDVTNRDCLYTIDYLKKQENPALSDFGDHLATHLENECFEFLEDFFWCQPIAFWDIPDHIEERLSGSSLVIIKGDANYRRALGDRQWSCNSDAKDILSYWQWPVVCLRILKAELACGITDEAKATAEMEDPNWMVSGKWAVVQFYCDS
jgi:hypothetical protein